jgi:homocitrate synthase NifV
MTILRLPAIVVNDSTLRDGEQSPGIVLTLRDRIGIALALERAGVDEIEFALPAARREAVEEASSVVAALGRARAVAWAPMSRAAVDTALRTGARAVHLSLPLSARGVGGPGSRGRIARIVGYARARGLRVAVCGEDASRADFDLVCGVMAAAEEAGAHRFRYADTACVLHPLRTQRLFRQLCAETDLELEFQGHDDDGLATANTFAAVQGGATHVSVSMLPAGRCAGMAPLAEVVNALRLSPQHHTQVDLALLPALAATVANVAGQWASGRRTAGGQMGLPAVFGVDAVHAVAR